MTAICFAAVGQKAKSAEVSSMSVYGYGLPMAAKLSDVEITQARDLDVERRAVRQGRTDLYARHDAQPGRRLDSAGAVLPLSPLAIW
jgi:hypothetical protein